LPTIVIEYVKANGRREIGVTESARLPNDRRCLDFCPIHFVDSGGSRILTIVDDCVGECLLVANTFLRGSCPNTIL
jgi:hypothetical protein